MENIPDSLRDTSFMDYGSARTTNQSPRLLNRQVKVAFFMLHKSLLEQVLNSLTRLLLRPGSWAASVFMSICLAILLERIEVSSRYFVFRSTDAQIIDLTRPSTMLDIEEYCHGVENDVFSRLYRMLSIKLRSGGCTTDAGFSHLASRLSGARQDFGTFQLTYLHFTFF